MNARTDSTTIACLVPHSQLQPSPTAVQAMRRARFTDAGIAELAASMAPPIGMLSPIIARETAAGLEIVAGEQRWRAAPYVQPPLTEVPVIVRDLSDPAAAEQAQRDRDRENAKHELESNTRREVLRQVCTKFKGPFKKPELQLIAEAIMLDDAEEVIYPEDSPNIRDLDEAGLMRHIIAAVLEGDLGTGRKPDDLYAMAKRLRIDPATIKKDLQAAAKKAAKKGGAK